MNKINKGRLRWQVLCPAAMLLLVIILMSVCLSVFASNEGTQGGVYDFSHAGSPSKTTLSATDIMELCGITLSEREAEFLSQMSSFSLTYSSIIATDYINLSYSEAVQSLTVTAEPYSYTSTGSSFCWEPVSVTFMNETLPITSGEAVFSSVARDDGNNEVRVNYSADAVVTRADINALMNFYHDTAKYIFDKEEYEKQSAAYEEYLHAKRIYDDLNAKYQKYLSDLKEYEEALYLYENYNEAIEKYNLEYKAYLEYLEVLRAYEAEYAEYLKNKNVIDLIDHQLLAMDIIKTPMTDGRSLYNVIFGKTVDSVLENKSFITGSMVGVEEWVVDLAGEATANVRAHIKAYFALGTREEKYNYYTINYDSLCRDFRNLTAALDKLYSNKRVRGMLIAEEKDKKYIILVAQLALVTDALIDGDVKDLDGNTAYGEDWKIEGMTRDAVLENKTYIADTDNSKPITTGIPPYIDAPKKPTEVSEPQIPIRPSEYPVMPKAVEAPGEPPTPVACPDFVTASPDVEAAYNALSERQRGELSDMYRGGEIEKRAALSSDKVIALSTYVTDSVSAPYATVTFYTADGEVAEQRTVKIGSALAYEGAIPQRAPDSEYDKYVFLGWCNPLGEPVSEEQLKNVEGDMQLYPRFTGKKRVYTVSWNLGNKTLITECEAGTVPTPPNELPYLPDDSKYTYVYAGVWDKPLTELYSDASYSAIFNKEYIVPLSTDGGVVTESGGDTYLELFGVADTEYDISRLINKTAGKTSLTVNTTSAKITFTYSDVLKMKEEAVKYLSVSVMKSGASAFVCTVSLLNESRAAVCSDVGIGVSLPADGISQTGTVLYKEPAGEREYVKYNIKGSKVYFTAVSGEKYTLSSEFHIYSISTALCTVTPSVSIARPGDRVYVSCDLAKGASLSEIAVTDIYGTPVPLDNNGYFIMPEGDVKVSAHADYKIYTVTFKVGGVVVATYRHKYGELPKAPAVSLGNDEQYSYRFIGWSSEITPVSADMIYEAVIKRTPLPVSPDTDEIVLQPKVLKLIVLAISAVAVILLGAVPSAVISTVFWIKRRKTRLKKGENHTKFSTDRD